MNMKDTPNAKIIQMQEELNQLHKELEEAQDEVVHLEKELEEATDRIEELEKIKTTYMKLSHTYLPMLEWVKDIMGQIADKERERVKIDLNDVSFRTARSMIQESLWEIEQ